MKKRVLAGIPLLILLSGCGNAPKADTSASELNQRFEKGPVTDAWGPLVVREGEFDASAKTTPWSGSWLPIKSSYLFHSDSGLSPLEKYDLYMDQVHGQKTHAADYERSHLALYDPNALGWEGRCDAWAAASVNEPEPTKSVTLGGVNFTVGDLKALLTETYEDTNMLEQFGSNFRPGRDFSEMYPEEFHKTLVHEIFENHRPFVFDNDPSEQVWNTPAYRASFQIDADPSDDHVVHVQTFVWGVSPFIPQVDYVGTLTVNYLYTYDLYGNRLDNGDFQVLYGEWTGDSKIQHPNFVSVLTKNTMHVSNNAEISTPIVNEILSKSRQ